MIQYFSKPGQHGPLKELPTLKQSLKIIKISYPHNSIQKITPSITKAHNTEQLDLSYNKISSIEPIFELRKLRIVGLSNNLITNVSKGILKLKKLERIDLSYNLLGAMCNVGPLLEMMRVRKGEFVFLIQGNKVMEEYGGEIEDKINEIKLQIEKNRQKNDIKNELKQLQITKSIQMHRRVPTQPFQQQKSSSHILSLGSRQMPITLAETRIQIDLSLTSLKQYARKFQVMMASQFKGWSQSLMKLFNKQSESVCSLVETYMGIIKCVTQEGLNPLQATSKIEIGFIRASQIQGLIKDQHTTLLEALSQNQVSMISYKIWVQLYRDLRVLAERIRWEAWSVVQAEIRSQQIEALKLISPSKLNESPIPRVEKLQGLLFSKNKEPQCQKQLQCSECFIKDEQIRQLKQISDHLSQQNTQLKQKIFDMNQQFQKMSRDDTILGQNLRKRQEQIVSSLNQKIDSSVYQKILLQQARGIEDLIKCDRHQQTKSRTLLDNTQKLRDLCQTATALAKDRAVTIEKEGVSQFYLQQNETGMGKMPYFNKNAQSFTNGLNNYKKSKRNTQNSISSTQKKRKFSLQNVQKRERNQNGSTNSSNMSHLLSRKTTERQSSEESPNKMRPRNTITGSQPKQETDRNKKDVIISNFVVTETGKEGDYKAEPISSRQVLAELIAKKNIESNVLFNQKSNKVNQKQIQMIDKKLKKVDSKEKLDIQKYSTYVPFDYHSVDLKDEEPYQNYMKFHLRNSIIETLEKKGKRYSLNKSACKDSTIKITSKGTQIKDSLQPETFKNSSRGNSSRIIKSSQKIGLKTKEKAAQNAKSYVQILGKLRH